MAAAGRHRAWATGIAGAVALAVCGIMGPAAAQGSAPLRHVQSVEKSFDIPEQPLSAALTAFGRQSGFQITADTASLSDLRSTAVRGTYAAEDALRRLLAGTGMSYRFLAANTITVLPARPEEVGERTLQAVHVEASKRGSEDVQRHAGSVYVFGQQELEESRARGIEGVLRQTPNASFEERPNGDVVISLRGNSTRNNNTDAAIGLYVDGAYSYIQGNNNNVPLFDVDQVNVLLGPQGSLYGRNAVGGAVNIQTANPTDRIEARAAVEGGNFDAHRAEVMANAPVENGRLRFRVAGFQEARDSYFFNRTNGRYEDGLERVGGRFKVGMTPHENVDVVLGVERVEQNLPGTALTPSNDLDVSITDVIGSTKRDSTRTSADIKWAAGKWLTVRSITGVNMPEGRLVIDGDGTAARTNLITNWFDATQISQEFRFTSPEATGGPLSWIAGVNYFRDRIDTRQETLRLTDGRLDRAFIDGAIGQYAVFGELTYEILTGLRLTGSLRYSYEQKDIFVLQERRNAGATAFATLFRSDVEDVYERVNPGSILAYDWTSNVMTYAKFATAYKSGGVNFSTTPTPQQATFEPEDVRSFEFGAKTQWFDNRLIANVSVFHQTQKDFQLRTTQGAISFFSNVGDGVTDGAELFLRARAMPGLDVTAGYGYLHAEFDNAPAVQVSLPPAGAAAIRDVSGNRIPNVPTHTFTLGATYRVPVVPWADGFLRGEYYVTRGGYADAANLFDLDPKNTANFAAGIEGDWFAVKLFVNNAFDEEFFEVMPTFGAPAVGQRNTPRTYGISGTLRW